MAKLMILEDCIDALTKVWIESWRGTPTWSSHYRGPALQTGITRVCETNVTAHASGCGGVAWVITEFSNNDLAFSDVQITIADQPVLCLPNDLRTHGD